MRKIIYILLLLAVIGCSKSVNDSKPAEAAAGKFQIAVYDMHGNPYSCGFVKLIYEESTTLKKGTRGNSEISAIRAIDNQGNGHFTFLDNVTVKLRNYQILDYLFQEIDQKQLDTLVPPGKLIEDRINLSYSEAVEVYWERPDFSGNYDLTGKRILTIVGDDYDFMECQMITQLLAHWGADVIIASNRLDVVSHYWIRDRGFYRSFPGPDSVMALLQDFNFIDFDCLFCPGGNGPANLLREYSEITDRIYQAWNSDTLLFSAICHGPLLLAESNIVDSRRITGHSDVRNSVNEYGGIYVPGEPVLVDGNIQTGNWPYFNTFATTMAGILEDW
jgi:protease I